MNGKKISNYYLDINFDFIEYITPMTIKIPKENFIDKMLAILGKKRAIRVPVEAYIKFGLYVYAKTQKGSFWHALFRLKN
jgi:hypothetical protein